VIERTARERVCARTEKRNFTKKRGRAEVWVKNDNKKKKKRAALQKRNRKIYYQRGRDVGVREQGGGWKNGLVGTTNQRQLVLTPEKEGPQVKRAGKKEGGKGIFLISQRGGQNEGTESPSKRGEEESGGVRQGGGGEKKFSVF